MLNESTISQARSAILSRNETVSMAFVNRTEDGLFSAVGQEYAPEQYERDLHHYEWSLNDRDEAKRIAKVRRVFLGYEVLTESKRLLDI